jgi:hypothetical protein
MASFSNGLTITRSQVFEGSGTGTLLTVAAGRYATVSYRIQGSSTYHKTININGTMWASSNNNTAVFGQFIAASGSVIAIGGFDFSSYQVHIVEFAAGG